MKKYLDEKELRMVLIHLLDYLKVVSIDEDAIRTGLKSKHKDFEYALKMISAYSIDKLDGIVTRNVTLFVGYYQIPILTPEDLASKL